MLQLLTFGAGNDDNDEADDMPDLIDEEDEESDTDSILAEEGSEEQHETANGGSTVWNLPNIPGTGPFNAVQMYRPREKRSPDRLAFTANTDEQHLMMNAALQRHQDD